MLRALRILASAFRRAYRLQREGKRARAENNAAELERIREAIAHAKAETQAALDKALASSSILIDLSQYDMCSEDEDREQHN